MISRCRLDISCGLSEFFLLIFLVIATLSITQAGNKILSFYSWLKILELAGLYFYVRSSLGKVFTLNGAFLAVIISGFFQSIIAIGQSLAQHSLGLQWLGESILQTNFNGVAVVAMEGGKFLRTYGTTPHPNVLAAWLFLGTFACYFLFLWKHSRFDLFKDARLNLLLAIYPVLLWGLFSTFSRIAIGLWGVVIIAIIIISKSAIHPLENSRGDSSRAKAPTAFKNRLRRLFGVTFATVIVFGFFYWPQVQSRLFISSQEQAVSQRILYTKMAGEIVLRQPWLGVGLGQFVSVLQSSFQNYPDYFYQPVHNIYLLILNETGFLGLAVFLLWLLILARAYYRRTKFKEIYRASFLIVFLSILMMGLFDHFLWTIQQGQLIFWLTLGLISSSGKTLEVV